MNWSVVVWIYSGLLLVGGGMGFIKAGSKASLIASSGIAAVLVILLLSGASPQILAGVLLFLAVYFASRYWRSRKLMPGGIFAVVSGLAAVAVYLLRP